MSRILKIITISLFTGLASGLLSSSFLHLLTLVTDLRQAHPALIWGLPFFGLLLGFVIKIIPHHINQGVPHILEEIENDKSKVSVWMIPFIFLSALGTHLFGGSSGREGVGVIMGAAVAHVLPSLEKTFREMKPFLIYAGVAAGFSSIFGTPLTAIAFAFELHRLKDIKKIDLVFCTVIASFVALLVPHYLGPSHANFEIELSLDLTLVPYVLIAGIFSGLGAHLFYWGLKGYGRLVSYLFPHLLFKLFVGGLLVSVLIYFTDSYQYAGIGVDVIVNSFVSPMEIHDFIMKFLLTVMTLAVGFKGGEVTPLFFMGATLSNSVASYFNLRNFALSSSLGMVGLFGAVTATPIASAIMAGELFGWRIGAMSFFSCWIARLIIGKRSVYRH